MYSLFVDPNYGAKDIFNNPKRELLGNVNLQNPNLNSLKISEGQYYWELKQPYCVQTLQNPSFVPTIQFILYPLGPHCNYRENCLGLNIWIWANTS